jgi:hypothetical protein
MPLFPQKIVLHTIIWKRVNSRIRKMEKTFKKTTLLAVCCFLALSLVGATQGAGYLL